MAENISKRLFDKLNMKPHLRVVLYNAPNDFGSELTRRMPPPVQPNAK